MANGLQVGGQLKLISTKMFIWVGYKLILVAKVVDSNTACFIETYRASKLVPIWLGRVLYLHTGAFWPVANAQSDEPKDANVYVDGSKF
jgi:hypothetical protein